MNTKASDRAFVLSGFDFWRKEIKTHKPRTKAWKKSAFNLKWFARWKKALPLLLAVFFTACGTFRPQSPQAPPSSTNLFTLNPSVGLPLQTVSGSGLPYASEAAAAAFAILSLIMAIKNRQLKKQNSPTPSP